MRDNRIVWSKVPVEDLVYTPLQMTLPVRKTTSLRRSESLTLRPKLVSTESGRLETPSDCSRVQKMKTSERTKEFYVLQPKLGQAKTYEGKFLQYSRPVLPLKQERVIPMDDSCIHTRQRQGSDDAELSPKSILKNFSAASYRNPKLVVRPNDDSEISRQSSSLKPRLRDSKGKQLSPKGHFRYRLSRTAPSSAKEKRVTFDEDVSYINENSLYRRRHSTPSLPLL